MHKLSKGLTKAAVATIPCPPDLRQLCFKGWHTRISNLGLADELQNFTNDCYALALYLWKLQDQVQTKEEDALRDIEWLGSNTFLNGSGYYDQLQSKTPRTSFRGMKAAIVADRRPVAVVTQPAANGCPAPIPALRPE